MSKQLKLKDGKYDAYLGILENNFVTKTYKVDVQIKQGQVVFLEDTAASERVGVSKKETTKPNDGQINWLFVFGIGFLAIAAFHLFVK